MSFAEWLNTTFANFDGSILRFMYEAELAFPWLIKLARFISYLCDKGIIVILITLIFLVFRKTRKQGVIIAIALILQVILINIIKACVARDRMFWDPNGEFYLAWVNAGKVYHSSFSFPSGHTANATAFAVGLFLGFNKKYSWPILLFPLIMAWSRVALFVHYPTDTIVAIILISLTSIGAYFISLKLFKVKFINKLVEGDTLF
jgi:undecaprenyl-diphosphatase